MHDSYTYQIERIAQRTNNSAFVFAIYTVPHRTARQLNTKPYEGNFKRKQI